MSGYHFDEDLFKQNFNAKDPGIKPINSYRLNHVTDRCFKLYPYKATTRNASPIVYDLKEAVSSFFRKTLGVITEAVNYDYLCQQVQNQVEIDDEKDIEILRDIIRSLFFKDDNFQANNIGLYPYQTAVENKSVDRIADFLYCVLGLDEEDKINIKKAEKSYPFNVWEKMVVESIEMKEMGAVSDESRYFQIKRSIQSQFKSDFEFMLLSGMTSLDDFSNILSFYYFYYVSQTALTLDQFGNGDRDKLEKLYFALDWEKVSKNRLCCIQGWNQLSYNIMRLFSHAITLEILNQNDAPMMDYIDFRKQAEMDPMQDAEIAGEIQRAEHTYRSYIGDCKFDNISEISGVNKTDSAIHHLFECVLLQFNNTERKRASQVYSEKFSEFCKARFVKNRRKSGLVLNLTEGDLIFLTKLALRDKEKIRLNDLYVEYELRGVYLDSTSKTLLQEFFTRLNLIDKKSDSGDAQYVKRIL